jgi:hypothetical protein
MTHFGVMRKYVLFDVAFYDNDIFELLDICPTFFFLISKFINMFPNIKRT